MQIFELIGKAMADIGAICKDSVNAQQGFKYRGIDAVYNTLYPVMAKYGLFITPEILDHKREERTTTKTYNGQTKTSTLLYSIITVKYTVYAPDGSFVCMTVIGEGMDSGDKATNKAMSIAMKYAMFQLFMIPTEAVDPDGECHEVDPRTQQGEPVRMPQARPQSRPVSASVSTVGQLPQANPQAAKPAEKPQETRPETPGTYMRRRIAEMTTAYQAYGFNFAETRQALIASGQLPDVPSATMTMEQAVELMRNIEGFYEDRKAAAQEKKAVS